MFGALKRKFIDKVSDHYADVIAEDQRFVDQIKKVRHDGQVDILTTLAQKARERARTVGGEGARELNWLAGEMERIATIPFDARETRVLNCTTCRQRTPHNVGQVFFECTVCGSERYL